MDTNVPGKHILVICMNYNNHLETMHFAHLISRQNRPIPVRVIIVDNSNTFPDISGDFIAANTFSVSITRPDQNLGYLGGAHRALNDYAVNNGPPEWVILSNTDIRFHNDRFFEQLTELYLHDVPAVIAPSIISDLSHRDQNPYATVRPSKMKTLFYRVLFRYYPISVAYQSISLVKSKFLRRLVNCGAINARDDRSPREIYAPHGSFIIFHNKYFNVGGTLNFGAFLFGEEIFIAETLRRLSLKAIYDPRLKVYHTEHAATGNIKDKKMCGFLRDSYDYIYDTFYR